MRIQWASFFLMLASAASVAANAVTMPAATLFKHAEPMGANGACTDGLTFTLPTITGDDTIQFNLSITFSDLDGHTLGSVFFENVCAGSVRSGQSYCLHDAGLSSLSSYASGGTVSDWDRAGNSNLYTGPTFNVAGGFIPISCVVKGNCSNTGAFQSFGPLDYSFVSCTPE